MRNRQSWRANPLSHVHQHCTYSICTQQCTRASGSARVLGSRLIKFQIHLNTTSAWAMKQALYLCAVLDSPPHCNNPCRRPLKHWNNYARAVIETRWLPSEIQEHYLLGMGQWLQNWRQWESQSLPKQKHLAAQLSRSHPGISEEQLWWSMLNSNPSTQFCCWLQGPPSPSSFPPSDVASPPLLNDIIDFPVLWNLWVALDRAKRRQWCNCSLIFCITRWALSFNISSYQERLDWFPNQETWNPLHIGCQSPGAWEQCCANKLETDQSLCVLSSIPNYLVMHHKEVYNFCVCMSMPSSTTANKAFPGSWTNQEWRGMHFASFLASPVPQY